MRSRRHVLPFVLLALGCGCGMGGEPVFFETAVRPILKAACFHCHGEDGEREGGLDLRLVRLMVAGGESGAAVQPGDPEGSHLWRKVAADEMPKSGKKLAAEDKEVIRNWIAQGAKTARPEPEDPGEARFTVEELSHWAFQPVAAVEPPEGTGEAGPIDAFVAARLGEAGLGFSEPAERRTLIRRLSFDLTGLPPAPEEVEGFVNDSAPEAWERVVDHYLASPQFGVRWARHWLDAAGYAESDGHAPDDAKRPHAWRYRDYVIESFNANKPVDQFIVEQLAGDELLEGERSVDNARHRELLTATGFLRMAPDATQRSNTLTDRNTAVAEAMQVVSTSLLGITVGCAQCHDHKYDPIGIDDYYRFRAIFDPAFPLENWQQPGNRLVDMTPADVQAARAAVEGEARKLEEDLQARRMAHCAGILEQKLADVPDEVREAVRAAVRADPAGRSAEQNALLETYPMVKPPEFISGLLVEYDGAAHAEFEKEAGKIAELRATMPPLRMIMATSEPPGALPVSKVFFRGNPETPREEVGPGELMVLHRHRPERSVPVDDAALPTSGRRLAYARQITDGTHPLTARVFVNRVWMHHFGRGLVESPGDFGIAGEEPSHPELLDWLAGDFVRHGWDQKRLHRQIVTSRTWQQRSARRAELDAVDPGNELLGRANLRRLDAESLRDALLAVTGELNAALGGPPGAVVANNEGKAVLQGDPKRRSIFVEVQRNLPLNMLATFDQPVMTPNCDRRRPTTVATQALWFLNDQELVGVAEKLAALVTAQSGSDPGRLEHLHLRLFGERPTPGELGDCEHFLAGQRAQLAAEGTPEGEAGPRALAALCQVLLASNRFLYLD